MDNQKDIFLKDEGNEWYLRNKHVYQEPDKLESLVDLFSKLEIEPKILLEIGCSNGSRLNEVHSKYKCHCFGIDPSGLAIEEGKKTYSDLDLSVGTADLLPFKEKQFDVIVFGFCLYLCDRKDLFKIAYEADRCLKDGGYIVLKDFSPPFAFKNTYTHKEGLYSYKMDYSRMFEWNPVYQRIYQLILSHSGTTLRRIPNEKVAITVLLKEETHAYLKDPFWNGE